MKTCRRVLISVFVLIVFCSAGYTQTNPNLETGFKPYGAYDDTSFDSISIGNGNLTLHIPLFDYPQRGALGAQARMIYNNKGWKVFFDCTERSCLAFWDQEFPTEFVGLGQLGMSIQVDPNTIPIELGTWTGGGGVKIWTFTGVTNDGATHQLAGTKAGGYRSIDATGIYFNDPAGVYGPYVVLDRHGNGYSTSAPNSWVDTNGNYFTYNSSPCCNWSDTLGRSLFAMANDGSGTTGCSTASGLMPVSSAQMFSFPAPGGGTRWGKLCYATVALKTNFNAWVTDPVTGLRIKVAESSGPATVIQSIIVDDGTSWSASPQWTFQYNDTDGQTDGTNYGDITQVTLPTGGTISYTWATWEMCMWATTTQSRGVTSRTINANDGMGNQTTTYGGGRVREKLPGTPLKVSDSRRS